MMTLQDPRTQIDDLLDRMAADLQLDDTRRDLMVQHYEAVKNWLKTDEKFFKPFRYEVYPHGSVRTLTTVKPFGRDEFDLDIVVHLKSDFATHTPAKIYAELLRRLGENEIFKTRLEAKNRCVRLNYAKDFHLDILPGIQESKWDENKLMVPDKERKSWVSCNPRGYADWFLAQATGKRKPA